MNTSNRGQVFSFYSQALRLYTGVITPEKLRGKLSQQFNSKFANVWGRWHVSSPAIKRGLVLYALELNPLGVNLTKYGNVDNLILCMEHYDNWLKQNLYRSGVSTDPSVVSTEELFNAILVSGIAPSQDESDYEELFEAFENL